VSNVRKRKVAQSNTRGEFMQLPNKIDVKHTSNQQWNPLPAFQSLSISNAPQYTNNYTKTIISKVQSHFRMPEIKTNKLEHADIPDSSLFSLLKHFNLSQYYNQLLSLGLGDSNPLIQLLNIPNRRKFVNQLQLMPGHSNKFMRMLTKLEKMMPRDGTLTPHL